MRNLVLIVMALFAHSTYAAEDESQRGAYLVNLLGCGGCHTQGLLLGGQTAPWMAGSNVGMAFGQAVDTDSPAVVFPSNLTPDKKTGLGSWSKAQIVTAIRGGIDAHNRELVGVMPWLNYSQLDEADASAIAAFLMSLPAVENKVPERVNAGDTSKHRYVRIGVYVYLPSGELEGAHKPPGYPQ